MPNRRELANAIRLLSVDAVEQAQSGHPGMPMGMADIAEVLWNDFLVHDPAHPDWLARDRFILSNGHGSMLHYALLHLTGYDVNLDDLKQFRQLHSKTPGHPEYLDTPGIETTTGPLGQGLANAVGMAWAERHLAHHFNRPDHSMIDHYTYVFCGDGCLMEGLSHEVCSLAGTLGLGKLIVFYDDNGISIDGETPAWFSDDTPKRFAAYQWHVIPRVDGHSPAAVKQAILDARAETHKPTLICCQTVIGFGAPNLAGTAKTHGAPLGAAEVAATRAHLEWADSTPFQVNEAVSGQWDARAQGKTRYDAYQARWQSYRANYPELAAELMRRQTQAFPAAWSVECEQFIEAMQSKAQSIATRKASLQCIEHFSAQLPELIGGSADLSGSNCTLWPQATVVSAKKPQGNYLHYGVREFGMSAMMNGMALYGGLVPMGGTFLVFCDYARNAVRMAALMKQRVIFVYSHDSIGLGEDGPTHQPVEHITMLRATPNLAVWRPCDAVETAVAWQAALENTKGPTSLLLSRQSLPHQERDEKKLALIKRGAYILLDSPEPELILMSTGSEVALAMEAAQQLKGQGVAVRVVSVPCMDVFALQDPNYRDEIFPPQVTKRIAIEAGSSLSWYRYVGLQGQVIGLDRFGASAPYQEVYKEVGLTVERILETVETLA